MKENLEKVKLLARDLRDDKEFPRSPRETLGGYVLAARAVDKCRTSGQHVATQRFDEDGAAFVHRSGCQHIAAQRLARTAREFLAIAQVAGQQFHFFEVFFHGFLPI